MIKKFLFLQGPHGPFFGQLAKSLKRAGCDVLRIGFTHGDRFFWPKSLPYLPFQGDESKWDTTLRAEIAAQGITDIVLYGDCRPLHQSAVKIAKELAIPLHSFEEGYLRPYWATYERGGTNGHSALMDLSVDQMRVALTGNKTELSEAPSQWGALWHHVWYGMLYHLNLLCPAGRYSHYNRHREGTLFAELRLHARRLATMPWTSLSRRIRTRHLLNQGEPYFLALLQLGHDSSIRSHSSFAAMADFAEQCIQDFANSAKPHYRLVFKAHPLEDGREKLGKSIKKLAAKHHVSDRIDYIQGGKLGVLLDNCSGVITINSTAAQQALWRGLPVRALGRSVFNKPEFVSDQPLVRFFEQPQFPDRLAYDDYRSFLLHTSQVPGGFYTQAGRAALMRKTTDMMLSNRCPYQVLQDRSVVKKHLKAVT
ncbi:MAG: capsular biosynthesis protein [Rhodobacteraceae bacterium]|nr:capsular biosynthesis protein [Paracoccaceae bacterium]